MTYLGEDIKKLGFGLMRLPKKDEKIDIEQVKVMVDKFLEAGFTYFDTAWAYAGSEDAIRQALVQRYPREKFQLATKNAAWINCKTREEAINQFETSLKQTGAGYFDFYLLHNLGESRTKFFDDFDMWNFVKEKKAEGLIKHIGFSFHSTPEELEEILIKHPEVEFVQYMKDFKGLTDKQQAVINEVQQVIKSFPLIPCTTCNYCAKVCPMNIGISGSFTAMNMLTLYNNKEKAVQQESWLVGGHGKRSAAECIKCGKCETVCPQHIPIRDELVKVADNLK